MVLKTKMFYIIMGHRNKNRLYCVNLLDSLQHIHTTTRVRSWALGRGEAVGEAVGVADAQREEGEKAQLRG